MLEILVRGALVWKATWMRLDSKKSELCLGRVARPQFRAKIFRVWGS